MDEETRRLSATVQQNCHIADASHARSYTMCVYLLKMREYYRWEKGRPFHTRLPKEELGTWLEERERLWEQLEGAPFLPLAVNGIHLDPFDTTATNRELQPRGLVYSGGLGSRAAPHFFLGRLLRAERRHGFTVLVSGREYARDLAAPPAMALNDTIFVRRESVRRMLWEKVEEWEWKRADGPMARAMAGYGFADDPRGALEQMTDREIEAVMLHEVGECLAGAELGEEWNELLLAVAGSPAEHMARAVRDHLADALSTLPAMLEQQNTTSVHFYFANFRGMRRELFPELEAAYRQWLSGGPPASLERTTRAGKARWLDTAHQLLNLYRMHGPACRRHIQELLAPKPRLSRAPRAARAIRPG
jgi:hypothetical protein